ncbi:MAG: hypothetical protein ACTJG1_14120, partial [Enterococcus gilvus]
WSSRCTSNGPINDGRHDVRNAKIESTLKAIGNFPGGFFCVFINENGCQKISNPQGKNSEIASGGWLLLSLKKKALIGIEIHKQNLLIICK